MAKNYKVRFEKGRMHYGDHVWTYIDYTDKEVIQRAKKDANEIGAEMITIVRIPNMDLIGIWEKKGKRWYRW